MKHPVVSGQYTPALRTTPLDRGDPSQHVRKSPLERGARQGRVGQMFGAAKFSSVILMLGLVLLAGCSSAPKPAAYEPLVVRFFLETRPGEAGVPVHLPVSGVSVTVAAKPVLVEYDMLNAEVAQVELGHCLMLQLTPAAARDLYRLSVASMGRRLVLTLNDEPVGARRIEQAMPDGTVLVFVERPDADLPALVERIKRTSADIVAAAKK